MSFLPWATKPAPSPEKTVLVIGGGIAGISAIHSLRQIDAEVKIVLVEPKEYCEILWASYRSPFEEWVAKGSLVRLDKYCEANNVEIVQATVTDLSKDTATCNLLADGATKTISFDVCTVATGATSEWKGMGRSLPVSIGEAAAQYRLDAMAAEGRRLLAANSVVIVGGGLIGTELAGDLAAYAKKAGQSSPAVTLIHSGEQLCPVMSPSAGAKMKEQLEGLGITVILNERGTEENGKVVLQNSKKEIEADIVVKTTGFVSVNSFMEKNFAESLNEGGWITTDDYFCVSGSDGRIFAYGDCSPTLANSGSAYMQTASVLGSNLKAALLEKRDDMKILKKPAEIYCNTAGPDQGVLYYSSMLWTVRVLPAVKNSTMFFMSPRDMLGVKKEFTLAPN